MTATSLLTFAFAMAVRNHVPPSVSTRDKEISLMRPEWSKP
jgi:hypothetical protein